jgi:hypothetical protein
VRVILMIMFMIVGMRGMVMVVMCM